MRRCCGPARPVSATILSKCGSEREREGSKETAVISYSGSVRLARTRGRFLVLIESEDQSPNQACFLQLDLKLMNATPFSHSTPTSSSFFQKKKWGGKRINILYDCTFSKSTADCRERKKESERFFFLSDFYPFLNISLPRLLFLHLPIFLPSSRLTKSVSPWTRGAIKSLAQRRENSGGFFSLSAQAASLSGIISPIAQLFAIYPATTPQMAKRRSSVHFSLSPTSSVLTSPHTHTYTHAILPFKRSYCFETRHPPSTVYCRRYRTQALYFRI